MSYEWALNKALKMHNRSLYVRRCKDGVMRVFQAVKQSRVHWLDETTPLVEYYDSEWLVCPLTHNWSANGRPVEWGIEPILNHIKFGSPENDSVRSEEFEKQQKHNEWLKESDSKDKHLNAAEDFYDSAKRAWSDIRYSNMDMDNDVRKKYEKRIRSS